MVLIFNNLLFQVEDRAKLEGAFCALSVYTRLLTYILSSPSLVTHLKIFLEAEMLATMVPKSADKRAYQAFATKEVIGFEGKKAEAKKVVRKRAKEAGGSKAEPNAQNIPDVVSESVEYPEVGNRTFCNSIMLNISVTV